MQYRRQSTEGEQIRLIHFLYLTSMHTKISRSPHYFFFCLISPNAREETFHALLADWPVFDRRLQKYVQLVRAKRRCTQPTKKLIAKVSHWVSHAQKRKVLKLFPLQFCSRRHDNGASWSGVFVLVTRWHQT